MDLSAHLLEGVIESSTPPGETSANARSRREAIVAMFEAFNPTDGMQAMFACQCIVLQFLQIGAMREACNTTLDPELANRARISATSISKTLHQWVSKIEKLKHHNEAKAAEAKQAAQQNAASGVAPAVGPPATMPRPQAAPPPGPGPEPQRQQPPIHPTAAPPEVTVPRADAVATARPNGGSPPMRAETASARAPDAAMPDMTMAEDWMRLAGDLIASAAK